MDAISSAAARTLDRVKYTPNLHVMQSVRNQNLPWWKILADLIDNSFDHGATRVVVTCNKGVVEVQDDGTGIKSIVAALTMGDHRPSNATQLGMYGVGLKDAWLSVGDKIEVATVHAGVESRLTLDLSELDSDWSGPAPISKESTLASGTTIRLFLRRQRNSPSADVWPTLAWAFTPALESGRQIVHRDGRMKKRTLSAECLPPLTDRITETFDVNGKAVSIDIGVMGEGQKMDRGPFWILYGHRIISPSSIGAKHFSTLRIAGRITLGKGWSLAKNKDGISDLRDELEDAIHERIKPLLEKAEQLTQDIESSELKEALESMINSAIGEAKREARNSPTESRGAALPGDTGRRRRNAEKIHVDLPGSVETGGEQKKRRGISVGWCEMGEELMGRFDSLSKRVDLNLSHPFIAAVKQSANSPALYSIAIALVAEFSCTHKDSNALLAFAAENFSQCFGRIMKSVKVEHGNRK